MLFYVSPEAESLAIRRAAARAGCRVERLSVEGASLGTLDGRTLIESGGPSQLLGDLVCADGWQAARLLLELSEEDAKTPGARSYASRLRSMWPRDRDFAGALHAMVKRRVAFVREHGEIFQSGAMTLTHGVGDCDDHARLVYGLAKAGGLDATMALLHRGDGNGPAHAVAVLVVDGRPLWAETTCDARLGEEPNAAAQRLGLTRDRSDIVKEVVIMTAKENQIGLDAEALQRLGFIAPCVDAGRFVDRADPELMVAVRAFQIKHGGLLVDGVLGPRTRSALAESIRLSPAGAGFDYTIGDAVPLYTHGQARAALAEAYRDLFNREPTAGELDFGLTTAFFETFYGRGTSAPWGDGGQFGAWAASGLLNWGALQSRLVTGDPALMARFRAVGLSPRLERGKDAGRPVFFYLFPDDVQAATAFLMTWGQPDTLAAAATGSPTAVAAAMKRHNYYEGFHVGPGGLVNGKTAPRFIEEPSLEVATAKNVAEYASALAARVGTVRKDGAGVPDFYAKRKGGGGGLGGTKLGGALLVTSLLATAAASWFWWRA